MADVAAPEDDTGGGVGGLERDTQTSPHGVVRHCQHRGEDEGELQIVHMRTQAAEGGVVISSEKKRLSMTRPKFIEKCLVDR